MPAYPIVYTDNPATSMEYGTQLLIGGFVAFAVALPSFIAALATGDLAYALVSIGAVVLFAAQCKFTRRPTSSHFTIYEDRLELEKGGHSQVFPFNDIMDVIPRASLRNSQRGAVLHGVLIRLKGALYEATDEPTFFPFEYGLEIQYVKEVVEAGVARANATLPSAVAQPA